MKRRLIAGAAAVLGTVLIGGLVVPTAASAADPVPTTVTLPLFGVPLTIDITTGPGGALTDVSVDSANATVATKLKPHKVVFSSTSALDPTADPAKVTVKSKHGGQSVSARAGTLADVSGSGSWSGDVFGDGIAASSVAFTIAGTDAAPDITGTAAEPATGITAVVGTVDHLTGDGDDDESSASARVSVKFTTATGDQSRILTISVRTKTDDDGDTSAKVSISLGRIKGVAIDAAAVAGPHTWSGVLCDNSAATITYDVALDGSVSNVVATPATADVKTDGGKIDVRFSHDERVRIKVREDNGLIKISVDERIRCRDAANPTTNVSTSIPADGNHGGDKHGHDGHGHDDAATTTLA
ncbi:MAG: hypothetical protein JJD93_07440 [Ilumatobacteraceae bacterium]|nr:hypothetical protein [Ilumatobacteraceae bacterium]